MKVIPYGRQNITEEDITAVVNVLKYVPSIPLFIFLFLVKEPVLLMLLRKMKEALSRLIILVVSVAVSVPFHVHLEQLLKGVDFFLFSNY